MEPQDKLIARRDCRTFAYTPLISQAASRIPIFPFTGMRVRLNPGYDIPRFTSECRVILQGLKTYGMILADNGLSGRLIGTPDTRWNDSDLNCLKQLTLSDFEPVNVSSVKVSNSSGQTRH